MFLKVLTLTQPCRRVTENLQELYVSHEMKTGAVEKAIARGNDT